jgi:hypothetical protein
MEQPRLPLDPRPSPRGVPVEFIGGPFDGFCVTAPALVEGVALPVSRNALLRAGGESGGQPEPATTIAFYQLERRVNGPRRSRYAYIGSISTRQAHLENWFV